MATNELRIGQGKTLVAICSAKPYWAALIYVWVTIWGNPRNVCLRDPRLVDFTPSTSAIVPGLSFSLSHPDSRVFLLLPPQNRPAAKIHLAMVLCSEIIHGRYSGSHRHPIHAFGLLKLSLSQFSPLAAMKGE